MKIGLVSGCVVWVLLFLITSSCLIPIGLFSASVTSHTDFVIQTMGGFMCPSETTPAEYTYSTTIWDSDLGASVPATGYELICVDASGQTVVNLGPTYAFVWTAAMGLAGAFVAVVLSILLAGPIGMIFAKKFGRKLETASGAP